MDNIFFMLLYYSLTLFDIFYFNIRILFLTGASVSCPCHPTTTCHPQPILVAAAAAAVIIFMPPWWVWSMPNNSSKKVCLFLNFGRGVSHVPPPPPGSVYNTPFTCSCPLAYILYIIFVYICKCTYNIIHTQNLIHTAEEQHARAMDKYVHANLQWNSSWNTLFQQLIE